MQPSRAAQPVPRDTDVSARKRSKKAIVWITLVAFTWQPLLVSAQVVADAKATQHKPDIDATANGVPLVQITAPSAAGVSRNQYEHFNVNPQGLILNNSHTSVQTQQAGFVDGNANLANSSPAKIILNEVTSSNQSLLRGFTEVAGAQAEVVIANRNGITCDGCGFINTSRSVLTTGVPVFGGTGSLDAFRVQGGEITVNGAGLNATNIEQIDLIARAVRVNSALWANDLNVLAGSNDVDYVDLNVNAIPSQGNAPSVGIDVAKLGGMYANKIRLVGTEAGVGVVSAGHLAAQGGDLTISNEGKVVLSGTTTATGRVGIVASQGISHSGAMSGLQNVELVSQSLVENSGSITSQQSLSIAANEFVSHGGLAANQDLTIATSGQLAAQGQTLAKGSILLKGGSLDLRNSHTTANAIVLQANAGDVDNSGANLASVTGLSINATGAVINLAGLIGAGSALNISARNVDNDQGRIYVTGSDILTISAIQRIDNGSGDIASNSDTILIADALSNAGLISAQNDLTLHAASRVDNNLGALISNNTLTVSAGAALTNQQGVVEAGKKLVMTATTVDNTQGEIVANELFVAANELSNSQGKIVHASDAAIRLDIADKLDNSDGVIVSQSRDWSLLTQQLLNTRGALIHAGAGYFNLAALNEVVNAEGKIVTFGEFQLATNSLNNVSGQISASGLMDISIAGDLDNHQGELTTDSVLNVTAHAVNNDAGRIVSISTDGLTLSASGSLSNRQGLLGGNGDVTISALNLTNGGTITAQKSVLLNAGDVLDNSAGTVVAQENITAVAAQITNHHGVIDAANTATLSAQTIDNSAGTVIANQLDVHAGSLLNQTGTLTQVGAGNTDIEATALLDNTAGNIITNGESLALTVGKMFNSGGSIAHAGTGGFNITASGNLNNSHGMLATNGALTLTAADVINTNGLIAANDALQITASDTLNNSAQGSLIAHTLHIDAQGVDNSNGVIEASDSLSIAALLLSNQAGVVKNVGTQASTLAIGQVLDNGNGFIGGNGAVSISAQKINNVAGTLYAGTDFTARSEATFNNQQGTVQSQSLMLTSLGEINNASGTLEANEALTLNATRIDNAQGRIVNTGASQTRLNAGSELNNSTGTVGGNGDVVVNAHKLGNGSGHLAAGAALTLNTALAVDNTGGVIYAGTNVTLNQAAATVMNHQGTIGAAGDLALTVAAIANQSGTIGANGNAAVTSNVLSGVGSVMAGQDLSVALSGDYLNVVGNQFKANRDLTFFLGGNFTNETTLEALGALNLKASAITNEVNGRIDSSKTQLTASGDIVNRGRVEGEQVHTQSNNFINTAAVIGGTVTIAADSLLNKGGAAIIASTVETNLYIKTRLENTDHALIYSVGNVSIAADSTRSEGWLSNATTTVINDSSVIDAEKNLEIAARNIENRGGVVDPVKDIENVLVSTTVSAIKVYPAYDPCNYGVAANASQCQTSASTAQVTQTINKQDILTFNPDSKFIQFQGVKQVLTYEPCGQDYPCAVITEVPAVLDAYFDTVVDSSSSVAIYYYPGYNPSLYIHPTDAKVMSFEAKGEIVAHHEQTRQTTVAVAEDRFAGSVANQPKMLAGQNMRLSIGDSLTNRLGQIASGKTIDIDGQIFSNAVSHAVVNNIGFDLYRATNTDVTSTLLWHDPCDLFESHCGDQTVSYAFAPQVSTEVYASVGATIHGGEKIAINVGSLNNTTISAVNSPVGSAAATVSLSQHLGAVQGNGAAAVPVSAADAGTHSVALSATSKAVPAFVTARQTVGTINLALPDLALPSSALFTLHTAPTTHYLIETDARFTDYTQFVSSDYMLERLNIDPTTTHRRLGDGFYEQQLVRDQITQLTSRHHLEAYENAEAQFQALMASGIASAEPLQLVPGLGLTGEQMAALTYDIVWLVAQEITLATGEKETVLVPVVYLSRTRANDIRPSGALIAADEVILHVNDLNNSGRIESNRSTAITAKNVLNRGGVINSGGTTSIKTSNDIVNESGRISGQHVVVQAGRDITNTTALQRLSATTANSEASAMLISQRGVIESRGDLSIQAGRDVRVDGSDIRADGDAMLSAGRNLAITTLAATSRQAIVVGNSHVTQMATLQQLATLQSGGDLTLLSQGDTRVTSAQITAGENVTVLAQGNLSIDAAKNLQVFDASAVGANGRHISQSSDESVLGASLSAGQAITLAAQQPGVAVQGNGNITLEGANIIAGEDGAGQGAITMVADADIVIKEAREEHSSYEDHRAKSGSLLNRKRTESKDQIQQSQGYGSLLSGDLVSLSAGSDLTVQGSDIVGSGDVLLTAKENVTIAAAEETLAETSEYRAKQSGFSVSGPRLTLGQQAQTGQSQLQQTSQLTSTVGSLSGNLRVEAGKDIAIQGSSLIAGQDLQVSGQNIVISAAEETMQYQDHQASKQSGISLGIKSPALDSALSIEKNLKRADEVDNERLKQLHRIQAASTLRTNANDIAAEASNLAKGDLSSVSVQVSVGRSQSESDSAMNQTIMRGSSVNASGAITFTARGTSVAGEAQPGTGDLSIIGSQVTGRNISLEANNEITLQSASNTSDTQSSNQARGGEIGVGVSLGTQNGPTISANAHRSKGNAESRSEERIESNVVATGALSIKSGGDTTLQGAQVRGEAVRALIAGDLNVVSEQDTATYKNDQSMTSVGGSASLGGAGSASVSHSRSDIESDYKSVSEQSGIYAGQGGFNINVDGHTQLTGAIIASKADTEKNQVITRTLTTSDIENKAEVSANSRGISLSSDMLTKGKYGAIKGVIGNSINHGESENISNGQTRSVISESTLTLTDETAQQQRTGQSVEETVANVNRDTNNAHDEAQRLDVQALEETALAEQAIRDVTFSEVTKISDAIYNSATADKKVILQICDTQGDCRKRQVDVKDVNVGTDGKVYVFNHGILNNEEEALRNAYQQSSPQANAQGVYVIINPHTGSVVAEVTYAGWDKLFAPTLGLSNATEANIDIANQVRDQGGILDVTAHSRGGITTENFTNQMKLDGVKNIPISTVLLNGSAGNASNVQSNLNQITSGQAQVLQSTHKDDFVGTLIGSNEATGGISGPDGFTGAHESYGPNVLVNKSSPYWGNRRKSISIPVLPTSKPGEALQ